MNLLFTVCGRAGSKGVLGKNTRDFCGVPLVWYTLAAIESYRVKYASAEDSMQLVLNTDSEHLITLAAMTPLTPFVIRRESDLSGDTVPKVSVIRDCLIRAEETFGAAFEMVVDLDITSPLRTAEDIRNAIEKKRARADTDVVFSVTEARRNPYFNMVKEEGGTYSKVISSHYATRQQAPRLYDMNASIYAYSAKAVKEKAPATFFNDHLDIVAMPDTGILDIDSEEDYALLQVIAQHFFAVSNGHREIAQIAKSWLEQ